jgi:hypothetical protein
VKGYCSTEFVGTDLNVVSWPKILICEIEIQKLGAGYGGKVG